MKNEEEERMVIMTDFKKMYRIVKKGLRVVPVAVQDVDSMEVLMLAYANRRALLVALQKSIATFWSTSRDALWSKGEESGNVLELIEVRTDCKQSCFLFLVKIRKGGACHTKGRNGAYRKSCFYRRFSGKDGKTLTFLEDEEWEPSNHKEYMLF